jgi:adenylate cyclase
MSPSDGNPALAVAAPAAEADAADEVEDARLGLDIDRFNELLIESAGVGLAIARPDSLEVTFCNRRFSEWFPDAPDGGHTLTEYLPKLDRNRLAERLEAGRAYVLESEIKVRNRGVHLAVQVARTDQDGVSLLIVESQNISKMKELEYMVESYSRMIEKNARDLRREKERVERLLLNIMPKTVYDEWKQFGVTTPRRYDEACVLMLDFAGFTDMAVSHDPPALIAELNDLFTAFDRIVEQYGGERIKTIGDAYMAISGIPDPSPDDTKNMANIALRIVHYVRSRNESLAHRWRCRVGINTGPVIGSIVGIQKYVYDIFGPGVNLAARMESIARPMSIALTEETYRLIQGDFRFREIGEREIKGFGPRRIYELEASDEVELEQDDDAAAIFDR